MHGNGKITNQNKGGRPKGSPNKLAAKGRAALDAAYEGVLLFLEVTPSSSERAKMPARWRRESINNSHRARPRSRDERQKCVVPVNFCGVMHAKHEHIARS